MEEAEAYHMPHDAAIEVVHGGINDPINARLDFKDYIMFWKLDKEQYFKYQLGIDP